SIEPFFNFELIDEIVVVVPREDVEFVRESINRFNLNIKVKKIVSGGKRRQDSVYNGLKNINDNIDYILIHDGVRPFINVNDIKRIVDEVKKSKAVTFCVPVRDTMIENDGDYIKKFVNRDDIMLVQTPQAFEAGLLKDAYRKAYEDMFYGTDDSSLVVRTGKNVKILTGSYNNIKITNREDLLLAETLLKKR
ncbi:2-C-methyl-D-erythritol 4-phosphate cytidylyltransferase, partial [candidate division KSB1 bacterium]